jgi:uncharacterized protein
LDTKPIYTLTCEDADGKSVTLKYSPHDSVFFKENDERIAVPGFDKLPSPTMYTEVDGIGHGSEMSPSNPAKKSKSLYVLKIQMGLNCNYTCAYCSQAAHLQHNEAVITNVDDARDFLGRLDEWLESAPKRIEFWGGEPFVYWKAMQVLVNGFRKKFPDASFNIVTNGSLLDEEKYEFIVQNDIAVAVSHDGPGQSVRGPDPLDDPEMFAVWKKFVDTRQGMFSFNSVLTSKNCDTYAIRKWFVDRFGEHVVSNYEGVALVHDDDSRNHGDVLFGQDDYNVMQSTMYRSIVEGDGFSNPTIRSKVEDMIRSFKNERSSKKLGQKCGMDREGALAVDLKGNALTCHNTGANSKHNIGSVYDFENISLDTSWHWSQRESCNYCPVLQTCQGSCMYLEGDDFVDSCNNEYAYNLPILLGSIELTFGLRVLKIEGDVRRPQKTGRKVIPIRAA